MDVHEIMNEYYENDRKKYYIKERVVYNYYNLNNNLNNLYKDVLFELLDKYYTGEYFTNNMKQYIVENVYNESILEKRVYDLSRVIINYPDITDFPDEFIQSLKNFVLHKENFNQCDEISKSLIIKFINMDEFYQCHHKIFECIKNNQFKIPFDVFVYRGIPVSISKSLKKGYIIHHSRWIWASLSKCIALKYTRDTSCYYERAFKNKDNKLSFDIEHLKKPRTGTLLKILIRKNTSYFDNSYHSGFGMESELIFSNNSQLLVLEVDESNDILTVELLLNYNTNTNNVFLKI
jgi:hypothetical protein